jgi:dipeptidyl aminopeptidase/acylaminoacyl peptidase
MPMLQRSGNVALFLVATTCLSGGNCVSASAHQLKQPFAVVDDIQLAVFGGSTGVEEELLFSPDGNYFVVETERGRPDLNGPEDSLRFYRCQDVEDFLKRSDRSQAPSPVWVVNRSTDKEGPIIKEWRWLADSRGMAFLERTHGENYRLVLADLMKKTIEPLTPGDESVSDFDVRDRQHYVYEIVDYEVVDPKRRAERQAAATVGTDRNLVELLFPDDPITLATSWPPSYLWAVVGDKRFKVKPGGTPLIRGDIPGNSIAMSPDGGSVIAALPVPDVPPSWETLYPPPFASAAYRIRAGHNSANQWVRIDLHTGSIQSLTDAPISNLTEWAWVDSSPRWSSDGQAVLLPGTYLKSKEKEPSRPCIAVVDLDSKAGTCVEMLKGNTETGTEAGFHEVQEASFVNGDKHHVLVRFHHHEDFFSLGTNAYRRTADGAWRAVGSSSKAVSHVEHDGLKVTVEQGLNEPPVVVVVYGQTSHVIWDPNPQLKNIELGQASVYSWKDKEGRDWRGGLYKPSNYMLGKRYPLVIQTHGFTESKFIPSGVYPTAFAARELAAVGIVVLQVGEALICPQLTPTEAACAVSGYEGAANQLVSEGLADPDRIGIIGFSRSCWYVMEMLTRSSLHVRAASVTDGMMGNYFQYLMWEKRKDDQETESWDNEFNAMIGSEPFGDGLQRWLKRSPGFNLDKVTTPLLVVA